MASERLLNRLRELGVQLPEEARLESTRASRSARRNGAWSWHVVDGRGIPMEIGSLWSMTELLASPELEVTGPDRFGAVHVDLPASVLRKS
jgi:hypothetical protein